MKYPNIKLGLVEAVWNKLGGECGVDNFIKDDTVVKVANRSKFPIWKNLSNVHKFNNYEYELRDGGYKVTDFAKKLVRSNYCFEEEDFLNKKVELVVVSLEDLGFNQSTSRRELYKRAVECGLWFCNMAITAQARVEYPDQPYGEELRMGMEPLPDNNYSSYVLTLSHNTNGCMIATQSGEPKQICFNTDKWVFINHK